MSEEAVYTRILRIAELEEEEVRERLGTLLQENNPEITTKASAEGVDICLSARGGSQEERERILTRMEERLRPLFKASLFGTEETTLQEIIGAYLDEGELTLATMESMTGGLIASALTDVHASSAHFLGGIVSYGTLLKERMGVPRNVLEQHGVISEETAKAMAHAVREFLQVEIGLGITGVAGPDKQEDQPVGTVHIAIDGPYGVMTCMGSERCAGSDREKNKQAATITALNLLRRYLERKEKGEEPCAEK
jgi:nicotinamide-nucleotide amidase